MRLEEKRSTNSERGWALASVLWTVTMLSLMATAAQDLTLTAHRTEQHGWDRARAEAALHAGLVQAILGIAAPTALERWRVDGVPRDVTFEGFRIKLTVQAESGRFDVNAIDGGTLTSLLRTAGGVASEKAEALSDTILDWRSPPGPHRLNAATDEDYAAAGLAYRPRHAAFQSVDELHLVLGMTKQIFTRIRPALTVYSKRAMIDPALAPREALLALYPNDPDRADEILKARADGTDIPSALYLSSHNGVINPGISLEGQPFSISAETRLDGRLYRRTAVIALTGDDTQPYLTLAWSDGA